MAPKLGLGININIPFPVGQAVEVIRFLILMSSGLNNIEILIYVILKIMDLILD